MTTISLDEKLNIDKVHFETLDEFLSYLVQSNYSSELSDEHKRILDSRIENLYANPNDSISLAELKEEVLNYGNKVDEETYLKQLNLIIEQLKQVKDFRLMERIKDIIQIHQLEEEQENIDIPKAHQELVMSRFDKIRKDTGRLLDWEEAKNKMNA